MPGHSLLARRAPAASSPPDAPALFGWCPCGGLSPAEGLACDRCVAAWRPYIRHVSGRIPADAELALVLGEASALLSAEVATAVRPASREAAPEWRLNQRCWCCAERRKCRPDPEMPGHWICPRCADLPA
jgi:hypothetical protein